MNVVIVWFRSDLRLHDNPALHHAVQSGAGVLPIYILDTTNHAWAPGAASRWWLHHSLAALDHSLRQRGNCLYLFQGDPESILTELIQRTGAGGVYANRRYEPEYECVDRSIQRVLEREKISIHTHEANLLHPPEAVLTGQGNPYKVFTPYYKASLARALDMELFRAPEGIPAPGKPPKSLALDDLGLLPSIRWDSGFYERWTPGEAAARQRLQDFVDAALCRYPEERDIPGAHGTSRLSPHLHFGEISPRAIFARLAYVQHPACDAFIRQLIWRDFAHAVLHHFPHTTDEPFHARFKDFRWKMRASKTLKAWQQGQTGVPIVDAGMRELWHTGWMHNRVRMIAGSFLTKNLLIHWLQGARWFWDTLVDADLAQNSMNWQWVAGCGVDAAPYFRIFNPVRQGETFDARGDYVRRWVPELAKLANKWLHKPWEAGADVLARAGITLGTDYPWPIVDVKRSRQQALDAYKRLK